MAFTTEVSGTLADGSAYTATFGPGFVTGSENVMAALATADDAWYAATPTGPFGHLDFEDPASVLGYLMFATTVTVVRGYRPDILGVPAPVGSVY